MHIALVMGLEATIFDYPNSTFVPRKLALKNRCVMHKTHVLCVAPTNDQVGKDQRAPVDL